MLKMTKAQFEEIVAHAKTSASYEMCGILAGKDGRVEKAYKMGNTSEDPARCYFMDPREQLKVMKEIRSLGLEMLAIYHSHPESEAYPSARDVELAYYPEPYYLIFSMQDKNNPKARIFKILQEEKKISEDKLIIE